MWKVVVVWTSTQRLLRLSCILFLSVSSEQYSGHGVLGVFLQHSDTTLVKVNTAMTKSTEAGPCQTAATMGETPTLSSSIAITQWLTHLVSDAWPCADADKSLTQRNSQQWRAGNHSWKISVLSRRQDEQTYRFMKNLVLQLLSVLVF